MRSNLNYSVPSRKGGVCSADEQIFNIKGFAKAVEISFVRSFLSLNKSNKFSVTAFKYWNETMISVSQCNFPQFKPSFTSQMT